MFYFETEIKNSYYIKEIMLHLDFSIGKKKKKKKKHFVYFFIS